MTGRLIDESSGTTSPSLSTNNRIDPIKSMKCRKAHSSIAMVSMALLATVVAAQESTTSLEVETDRGWIVGERAGELSPVAVFRGIPYAEPPVGDLRWRAPQPKLPWADKRPALEFGPACVSQRSALRTDQVRDEDCLYLNVWTRSAGTDQSLPVMVWIHGGAFSLGSGHNEMYDGTRFAESGVVLVALNYRLGLFGFFAHPALAQEEGGRGPFNQGILDQIAALQWVQRNIERFGGDPGRVTIFGESAGSISVCYLMASPFAKGLFHRAIGQSGGCLDRHPTLLDGTPAAGRSVPGETRLGGHEVALRVAAGLEASGPGLEGLAELRGLTLRELVFQFSRNGLSLPRKSVYVDGHMFPDQMRTLLEKGLGSRVPLLVGSNTDEGRSLFVRTREIPWEEWSESVRNRPHGHGRALLEAYAGDAKESTRTAQQQMLADSLFAWNARQWARTASGLGDEAFLYVFSHAAPSRQWGRTYGAYHAAEIRYVFGNPLLSDWNDQDHALADLVHTYWVNFATKGDPNGDGLPEWPAYHSDSDIALNLNADPEPITNYRMAKLDTHELINSF